MHHSPEQKAAHREILGYVQELSRLKQLGKLGMSDNDLESDIDGTRTQLHDLCEKAIRDGHGKPGPFSWFKAEQAGKKEAHELAASANRPTAAWHR